MLVVIQREQPEARSKCKPWACCWLWCGLVCLLSSCRGEDLFGLQQHLHNWLHTPSTYDVLFVRCGNHDSPAVVLGLACFWGGGGLQWILSPLSGTLSFAAWDSRPEAAIITRCKQVSYCCC